MNRKDLSNISYNELKADLVSYLKTKPEFSDFSFEGSNLAYLIDMITFSTYHSNVYNAFSLNESFLDTANIRSNVVAHGLIHGYTPSSSKGAEMKVQIGLDIIV